MQRVPKVFNGGIRQHYAVGLPTECFPCGGRQGLVIRYTYGLNSTSSELHPQGFRLPSFVELIPGGPVSGVVRPPGSKSLTNRALVCAAFANGPSCLSGALRSDDTLVMIEALQRIGICVKQSNGGKTLQVIDAGRAPDSAHKAVNELFIGNSGTTIRFLTAALSAFGGHYRLSGVPRMHERPIGDLVNALAPICQGTVTCENPNGCPPVSIATQGWSGNRLRVAGSVSSQYLSGLMLAAPIARSRVEIEVTGELVSRPYVDMTAKIMQDFGAEVKWNAEVESDQPLVCQIDGSHGYTGCQYEIEPDASAASYYWAAAAISGGKVTVEGLGPDAMQGDVAFVDCLEQMGCDVIREPNRLTVCSDGRLHGIDVDMNSISDTVQTLCVVALFATGPTRIRGVAHNRFKETDRIGDLACELRKLGATVVEHGDGMTVVPGSNSLTGATLKTYDDHRMAMSLSLAGLRISGVKITNPACTAKTYPDFFADLEQLIGRAHHWSTT